MSFRIVLHFDEAGMREKSFGSREEGRGDILRLSANNANFMLVVLPMMNLDWKLPEKARKAQTGDNYSLSTVRM